MRREMMTGPVDTARVYREKALSRAALLSALATSKLDGPTRLHELKARQDDLVVDLLHEFAFSARKYIELATTAGIPLRPEAERKELLLGSPVGGADPLGSSSFQSLWWVLGRIIHSEHLAVSRQSTWVDGTVPPRFLEHAWAFEVRSDHDAPETVHFVFLEFMLERFVELDAWVADRL
jgi:hypothetical protein